MRKNVSQKIMAWLVCAVFMLAITGQAFAENAGKSDQIHEGNPSTSQEPELENSAKMVDFSVSEEELSEELYEEALPNLDAGLYGKYYGDGFGSFKSSSAK